MADVSPEALAKETEIEMGKEDLKSKPENIRENIQFRRFERFNLGEGIEKKESNLAADIEEQAAAMKKAAEAKAEAPVEAKKEPAAEAVQVSAKDVKTLREM